MTHHFPPTLLHKYAQKAPPINYDFQGGLSEYLIKHIPSQMISQWALNNHNVLQDITGIPGWRDMGYYLGNYVQSTVYRLCLPDEKDKTSLEMKVSETSYLAPYQQIPALYLFRGTLLENNAYDYGASPLLSTDPKLAQDDFVVIAIYKITAVRDPVSIKNFLIKHQTKINEIRRLSTHQPRFLGGGADGVAFDIADRMILKIFGDQYAFQQAEQAMTRLHKNPTLAKTEANIYDVDILGKLEHYPLYYYIMEKMEPINRMENRNLANDIGKLLYAAASLVNNKLGDSTNPQLNLKQLRKTFLEHPEQHEKIKHQIDQIIAPMVDILQSENADYIESINNQAQLKSNWLTNFVEELLIKLISGRIDTHVGNLGITQTGELRFFDPAYKYADGWI